MVRFFGLAGSHALFIAAENFRLSEEDLVSQTNQREHDLLPDTKATKPHVPTREKILNLSSSTSSSLSVFPPINPSSSTILTSWVPK